VIDDVLGLCGRTLRRRRITVDLELEPNLPPILGDRVQLRQLLLNLILNGAEAMAGVTGRSRRLTVRSWRADAERVALAVSDSGTGLEGHDAATVFAPLARAKPDGVAVGLSVSRSIAEAHGGCIRVTRDTPQGATFEVELPGV
jgi:C4-dicarboxylate-specific signal transduction histidine kinase